jgi:hypothetical protein
MVNGVKARGFTAEYISSAVPRGSAAGTYDGRTLLGWGLIIENNLQMGSAYVKMHLLPDGLGGDANDSNLTPAPGPLNLDMSRNLERAAIDLKDGVTPPPPGVTPPVTIWYRVTIDYHGGTLGTNYPSLVRSEWGTYRRNGTQYDKVTSPARSYSVNPPLPAVTNAMLLNNARFEMLVDFLRVDVPVARMIVRVRRDHGAYTSPVDLVNKLETHANTRERNLIPNFDTVLDDLAGRLANYTGRITY